MISTTARKAKRSKAESRAGGTRRPSIVSREACEQVNRALRGPSLRFGPSGDSLFAALIPPPSAMRRGMSAGR